jgi:hypothetical protein
MLKVLLTATATIALLAGIASLPRESAAAASGSTARGGDALEWSSQQKLSKAKKTRKATVGTKIKAKKIGARAPRPSVKLNPQPEPPSVLQRR